MAYEPLHESVCLEDRAAAINTMFNKADRHTALGCRARWEAGRELLAAQADVKKKGLKWKKWCRENISRSYRDITKVMKMGAHDEPEAAHEEEKAEAREAMAEFRSNMKQGANTPPLSDAERRDRIDQDYRALSPDYRALVREDMDATDEQEREHNIIPLRRTSHG